jgi:16S rRNA C1402 (ribose-2'-O) methylase RsmI
MVERAAALAHHGEMVLVVGGCATGENWSDVPLEAHVEALVRALDVPRKEAIRYAASVRGLDRKAVYKALLPKKADEQHDDKDA